uniref:KASH domain-containing protein n=1 Tax=Strongyloides papillosus TaxID=174720 RepID=A0A0N5BWV1_STREA
MEAIYKLQNSQNNGTILLPANNISIEVGRILKSLNGSLVGIFEFEENMKKVLQMEKQLNDLKKRVTLLRDTVVVAFLNRRFLHTQGFIETILKYQSELENNTALINSYFTIKNELISIIDKKEKDDEGISKCLDKYKIFHERLSTMGRYVDIDVKESLEYLIGLFYLKWESLENFVIQKNNLSNIFKADVDRYYSIFSEKKHSDFLLLHDNVQKLKNDIEIEMLIVEEISLFPEVGFIYENLKQTLRSVNYLNKSLKNKINCLMEVGAGVSEYKSPTDFKEKTDNLHDSCSENKSTLKSGDFEEDVSNHLNKQSNSNRIKSNFKKCLNLPFTLTVIILLFLFWSYVFFYHIGTYGCHFRKSWTVENKGKYFDRF